MANELKTLRPFQDRELSLMQKPVMVAAQQNQISETRLTAIAPVVNVAGIHEARFAALGERRQKGTPGDMPTSTSLIRIRDDTRYHSHNPAESAIPAMLDLPTLILNMRPDLRALFPADQRRSRENYLGWLLQNGTKEYRALLEDESYKSYLNQSGHGPDGTLTLLQYTVWQLREDLQAAYPLPDKAASYLDWFYSRGLEEFPIWPYLDLVDKLRLLAQSPSRVAQLREAISRQSPPVVEAARKAQVLGVNLIGYVYGQLGIGEDVRMAGRSLLAAGIPFRMVDFPPGPDVPKNDRSMAEYDRPAPDYPINVFCLTAEETGRFYAERGKTQLDGHYNIGYWPWELGKWPQQWEMLLELVNEVWVSTEHTRTALARVCNKPLYVMPMAVELGPVETFESRARARQHFSLPATAKLFCFSFDLVSWIARKNPQACVDAFLKAFPKKEFSDEDVGLVIKAHRPHGVNATWNRLKALAVRDRRIHIIEGTLPRPELLALYLACDCFVSLHRAEGFGRGLAEALQLGLHAICTGYSGNVDFCVPPYADLVRYELVDVGADEYTHTEGQVWAEPSVEHAAELMRSFVERRRLARKTAWPEFSAGEVGKRYRKRLGEILNRP